MPQPAAKESDEVVAMDTHLANHSPVEVPFKGKLDDNLSPNVFVLKKHAATIGSTATNIKPHEPPQGKTFDKRPSNQAVVSSGSETVFINNRRATRNADKATTCNDPKDLEKGTIVAGGSVLIGR